MDNRSQNLFTQGREEELHVNFFVENTTACTSVGSRQHREMAVTAGEAYGPARRRQSLSEEMGQAEVLGLCQA